MTKALITGAHGFIGARLSEILTQRKISVRKLKRGEWDKIDKIIKKYKPDFIFHLASYGNHSHQKSTKLIYRVNISNFLKLLEAANQIPFKAFINTGSSSEYGRKDKPMKESDALEPVTHYGATKAAATLFSRVWATQYDLPIVTVRPFSVFGPREARERFIPTLIKCALRGDTLTLAHGVHDWIYIDDFVTGMLTVAKKANRLKGRVVNIGTGIQYTNSRVVKMVQKLMDRKIKVENVKMLRNYDTTKSWVANNSLITSLDWKPKYTIEKGLQKTIEYYTKIYNDDER